MVMNRDTVLAKYATRRTDLSTSDARPSEPVAPAARAPSAATPEPDTRPASALAPAAHVPRRNEIVGGIVEEWVPVTPGLLYGAGWEERRLVLDLQVEGADRVISIGDFDKLEDNEVAFREQLEGRAIALVGYVSRVREDGLFAPGMQVQVGRRFDGKEHFGVPFGTDCVLAADQRASASALGVGDLIVVVGTARFKSLGASLTDSRIVRHVPIKKLR